MGNVVGVGGWRRLEVLEEVGRVWRRWRRLEVVGGDPGGGGGANIHPSGN